MKQIMYYLQFIFKLNVFFIFLSGCNKQSKEDDRSKIDHVVSFLPKDVTDNSREPIVISFDKKIAVQSMIGKSIFPLPVKITPNLKTVAVYKDEYSISIKPLSPMTPSTRYTVSLGTIGDISYSGNKTFSFVNRPFKIKDVKNLNLKMASTDPQFIIEFNLPVKAEKIIQGCKIVSKKNKHITYDINVKNKNTSDKDVYAFSKKSLKKNHAYTLLCMNIKPEGANEGLLKPFKLNFKTRPDFNVQKALPSENTIPPEGNRIKIIFSTPVSRDEFNSNIHMYLNGQVLNSDNFESSDDGRIFKWNTYLEALSNYKIVIKKEVKDIFKRVLDKNIIIKFKTTDAPPELDIQKGIYAIEDSGRGYQLWSRNVSSVKLTCAKINPDKIATIILNNKIDFYPWYKENKPIKWKKYGLKPVTTLVELNSVKNRWNSTIIDLSKLCSNSKNLKDGLFLAEFENSKVKKIMADRKWGTYPYRLLGNVTNLGVMIKNGTANGLVWVTDLSGGNPVPGANVVIYDTHGKKLFKGKTDRDGIVKIPGNYELNKKRKHIEEDYYSSGRLIAIVKKGSDIAVADGDWDSGISAWNFNFTPDHSDKKSRIRGFIQSDRGIYRPGEKVFFKGLVREIVINKIPFVPKNTKALISIEDSTGDELFKKSIKLDEFGAFYFNINLSRFARLGDYYVHVKVKDQNFEEEFFVEDFKPVSFEILNKTKNRSLKTGERINFRFKSRYLFGPPVKEASVYWSAERRTHHVWFKEFPSYSFSKEDSCCMGWYMEDWYNEDAGGEVIADGELVTDANGITKFSVKDNNKKIESAQDYIIKVRVTDPANQQVTKKIAVTAHPYSFYLGINADNWIYKTGEPVTVNTIAISPDAKKIKTNAELKLIRQKWKCNYKSVYSSYSTCKATYKTVITKDISIGIHGAKTEIIPKEPGDYILRVSSKDETGKTVEASTSIWVTGKGASWVDRDENHKMTLIPSKSSYQKGETATIIPKYNTSGSTMLLTVEREGIMESKIVKGVAYGEGINVALKDTYAPNVYVSLAAVSGRKGEGDKNRPVFAMGIVNLKMDTTSKNLKVTILTEKKNYKPGETVKAKIKVSSFKQPVVSQLSVSVADEGVLKLINYKTPNPMDTFYKPWDQGVGTATNYLKLLRIKYPDQDNEEGADSGRATSRIRSKFVSSAFWNPAIVTDKNGEAEIEFKAPDNLTAFRIMAVAATKKDLFGSGEKRFTVFKKVLAKAVLPRFFRVDDKTEAGAVIYNYSGKDGKATVKIKAPSLGIKSKTKSVTIKKGSSKPVLFDVITKNKKNAKIYLEVKLNNFKDAFKKNVPVKRNIITERKSILTGRVQNKTVNVSWPEDVIKNESSININIDRFGLGMFSESLSYLIAYPYGCLEQTISRLLPMIKLKELVKTLKIKNINGVKLDRYIKEGIQKIYRFQDDEGFFSLWIDDGNRGNPYLTAYALWGLNEIERSGYTIKKKVKYDALDALKSFAGSRQDITDKKIAAQLSMAAYIFAVYDSPDEPLNNRLFENLNFLPVYAKAFLMRALFLSTKKSKADIETSKEKIEKIVTLIKEQAGIDGDSAFIKEEKGLDYLMSSSVRTTAMVISALIEVDKTIPLIDKLIKGLKEHMGSNNYYSSTQENLYALIAINDYITLKQAEDATVKLSYNDQIILEQKITGKKIISLNLNLKNLKEGKLSITSSGKIYINAALILKKIQKKSTKISHGINIQREFLDLKTLLPVSTVKSGDVIKVRVTVATDSKVDYLAVEDPFPAGFEPVNTKLETEDDSLANKAKVSWQWDFTEQRDSKMLAFADKMSKGQKIIEYLLRATHKGVFNVPPASAHLMYKPQVNGRSQSASLQVVK